MRRSRFMTGARPKTRPPSGYALTLAANLAVGAHRRALAVALEPGDDDGVAPRAALDRGVAVGDHGGDQVVAGPGVDARARVRRHADLVVAVAAAERVRPPVALDVVRAVT